MPAITIRRAQPSDLPQLSDIWHEKMVVQQQLDQRFTLAQTARQKWLEYTVSCLAKVDCAIWVAEINAQLVGYMIAYLQDSPPGLLPEKVGCIIDVALDVHNPQPGLGQQLLLAARVWFAEQDVQIIIAHVSHRQVVEQAFWRAQGATEWMDLMWLKL